jgi:hypothetical protein
MPVQGDLMSRLRYERQNLMDGVARRCRCTERSELGGISPYCSPQADMMLVTLGAFPRCAPFAITGAIIIFE